MKIDVSAPRPPRVGLALSGGGSRAIAFHLGCLRALHDLGILQQSKIISTVSGGSVIGAAYAYRGYSDFDEFDRDMVALLRTGLQRSMFGVVLFSRLTLPIFATLLLHLMPGMLFWVVRKLLSVTRAMTGLPVQSLQMWLLSGEDRLPVWATLSTALEYVLDRRLFRGRGLGDVKHENLEVVINACDLRTGTAFRFGSRHSGGWRYGRISDADAFPVAKAVAASAAFPVLLPPLIESFNFVRSGAAPRAYEIALSDGGVFDNLGVNVLEPGRDPSISVNVSDVTHILCLNAGAGQSAIGSRTLWMMPRLKQSFEIAHRRVQEAAYSRLHRLVESGLLSGFVMAYLGQEDAKLPAPPPDLVPRSAVREYPTDFAAMSEDSIGLLATRGEQLTRLLISRYLADI